MNDNHCESNDIILTHIPKKPMRPLVINSTCDNDTNRRIGEFVCMQYHLAMQLIMITYERRIVVKLHKKICGSEKNVLNIT